MACEGHSHDHEHGAAPDETNSSLGASLRTSINLASVQCLNESRPNSGREILKLYENRLSSSPALVSLDDPDEVPELLLIVPFTEIVTIKSICIHSGNIALDDDTASSVAPPRTVRIYVNRPNLDFETARDLEPTATITLVPPSHQVLLNAEDAEVFGGSTVDYPLRPAGRFQNVNEIALYFCDNYAMPPGCGGSHDMEDTDEDCIPTIITYVGFKGKGTNMKRQAVEAVYETLGMKKDHQVPGAEYFAKEGL